MRLGFALVSRRGDGGAYGALAVQVQDDAILAQLLLDEHNLGGARMSTRAVWGLPRKCLLSALDDKVAARVQRTLPEPRQLRLAGTCQHAAAASQHQRQPANKDASLNSYVSSLSHQLFLSKHLAVAHNDLLATREFTVHVHRRGVCDVAQPAVVGRQPARAVVLLDAGRAHVDVRVPASRLQPGL